MSFVVNVCDIKKTLQGGLAMLSCTCSQLSVHVMLLIILRLFINVHDLKKLCNVFSFCHFLAA